MNILVTGATGTIGRRLVNTLVADGHRPTVLTRDPQHLAALGRDAGQVSPVIGDYADPTTLEAAMRGVDRVFLVSPNSPAQVGHETAVIDAAARAGVSRLVKVSAHGADPQSAVAFWRWHAEIEQHLAGSGVPYVALRPTFSMANILGHATDVATRGVVFAPEVHTPIAMIDPGDVADVAARLLTSAEPVVTPAALELTGPDGVTFDDLAAIIARLNGTPVTYRPGNPAEVANYLGTTGTPPFVTEQILAIFAALRSGTQSRPLPHVADLLGRPPRTLSAFLADHTGVFRAAS